MSVIFICPTCQSKYESLNTLKGRSDTKKCPNCGFSATAADWQEKYCTGKKDEKKEIEKENQKVKNGYHEVTVDEVAAATQNKQPQKKNTESSQSTKTDDSKKTSPVEKVTIPEDEDTDEEPVKNPFRKESEEDNGNAEPGGNVDDAPEHNGEADAESQTAASEQKADEGGNPFRKRKEERKRLEELAKQRRQEAEQAAKDTQTSQPADDELGIVGEDRYSDEPHKKRYAIDDDDTSVNEEYYDTGSETYENEDTGTGDEERPTKTKERFEHEESRFTTNEDGYYNDVKPFEPEKKDTDIFKMGIKLVLYIGALFGVTNFLIYYFA